MSSQRYKLTIAYRGTNYYGWTPQVMSSTYTGEIPPPGEGIATIHKVLSREIETFLGHPIRLVGSSRTDSGVHAKGQVAHFDTDQTQIPPEGMREAINHQLPDDILIRKIEPVPDSFDAIASTLSKRYQYVIWHSLDRPVHFADLVWHRWKPMDIDAMREAAKQLVGRHDFTSFAKPGHKRETSVRNIYELDLSYRPPRLVIGMEAGGFLWQMVRIIVGTLAEVGLGRWKADEMKDLLEARDRRVTGQTAPASGLFLQWVRHEQAVARATSP